MGAIRDGRSAVAAVILQAQDLGESIERLGADLRGDATAQRAVMAFDEALQVATDELARVLREPVTVYVPLLSEV